MPKRNGRNSVYPNMEGEIKLSIDETRLEELREWHDAETNDPETQEWRDDLTPDEMAVVAKWDRQYALGIGKLAQAIIAQQHMNKLPETCLSVLPGSGELIVIKRGESGYYHSNWNTPNAVENREIADFHNRKRGITHAQEEAMLVGSMAGWDVPGADPDSYEEKQQEKSIQDELPYKLPATCMSVSQSSGELIIIERGTSGYVCSRRNTNDTQRNRWIADEENAKHGITKAEEMAMYAGCTEGWDSPKADPAYYERPTFEQSGPSLT